MDAKTYFSNGRKRIKTVKANDDYSLLILFDNGEWRRLDLTADIQRGGVFADIRPMERFRSVYIDEFGSVAWDRDPTLDSKTVWRNKIDICPDRCYMDSIFVAEPVS